ncbi:hypothetical protein LSH36_111g00000 [Paralvinella palmiformis]|uniref:Uncharacterized protein n=1 Tax=Paralvinella palmiformis TaxID=53620 RepID=A0AAD9NB42_9ANNE|nr:hypothetical protein LSH36_111g00000 [Paralvinella palmiformis]
MNQATSDSSSSDDEATEQTKLMTAHIQNERLGDASDPVVVSIQPTSPQARINPEYSSAGEGEVEESEHPRSERHDRAYVFSTSEVCWPAPIGFGIS